MNRWYDVRNKIIDKELWFNANDLLYALEDAKDFLKDDNISLELLLKSMKESSLESLKNALRD